MRRRVAVTRRNPAIPHQIVLTLSSGSQHVMVGCNCLPGVAFGVADDDEQAWSLYDEEWRHSSAVEAFVAGQRCEQEYVWVEVGI